MGLFLCFARFAVTFVAICEVQALVPVSAKAEPKRTLIIHELCFCYVTKSGLANGVRMLRRNGECNLFGSIIEASEPRPVGLLAGLAQKGLRNLHQSGARNFVVRI